VVQTAAGLQQSELREQPFSFVWTQPVKLVYAEFSKHCVLPKLSILRQLKPGQQLVDDNVQLVA
jgi:hypothetical protein